MQRVISQGDISSVTQPLLDMWFQKMVTDVTGVSTSMLAAPSSISFRVYALSTEGDRDQVWPVSGEQVVDLTADRVADAPTGHYVANWDSTGAEPGRYEVRWTWQFQGLPVTRTSRFFDVLDGAVPGAVEQGYISPSDMRAEGVSEAMCSTARLMRLIRLASQYVERVTGRYFEPRYKEQRHSGSGGRICMLDEPLIALVSVTLGNPVQQVLSPEGFRLFNRHISERMTRPDDRHSPKIEFWHFTDLFGRQRTASATSPLFGIPFRDLFFPAGVLNIGVTGLWGYTDWDGSCIGDTPELIQHATKLLVMREIGKMGGACAGPDREDRNRHRIIQERTRDQQYMLQAATEGAFTGNREIDDILLMFMRGPTIGSA